MTENSQLERICTSCGDIRHYHAKGLCKKCYMRKVNYPSNYAKKLERTRQYRLENHEKMLTYERKRRMEHRDRIRVQDRKYHQKYYYNGNSDTIRVWKNKNGNLYWVCGHGRALHRVIVEKILGRKLKSNEVVHHIDGNGLNNAHDNLLICSRSFHAYLHKKLKKKEVSHA